MKKIAIVFIALIAVLTAVGLLLPDREFSDQENRYLEQAPELSLATLLDGSFMADLDTYLTDQVPLRDLLVKSRNSILRLLGQDEINDVYFGKNGRLFQIYPENNAVLGGNIAAINAWAENKEAKIYFALAPTATAVYPKDLSSFVPKYDYEKVNSTLKATLSENIEYIELLPALSEYKAEQIYFAADHHWTMRGAYRAYGALGEAMGFEPEEYESGLLLNNFYGSLYSRAPFFGFSGEEFEYFSAGETAAVKITGQEGEYKIFREEKLSEKDKYTAFMGGNYGEAIIENPSAPKGTLVVFKDSYANALLPFLAEEYSTIYVVDLRYSRGVASYLEDKSPEAVLFLYNADFMVSDNNFVWLNQN